MKEFWTAVGASFLGALLLGCAVILWRTRIKPFVTGTWYLLAFYVKYRAKPFATAMRWRLSSYIFYYHLRRVGMPNVRASSAKHDAYMWLLIQSLREELEENERFEMLTADTRLRNLT